MTRIFLSGARPAFGFGARVNGLNDVELRCSRRLLIAAHPPSSSGTSLTARLALHGDPCGNLSVAPALAWSAEVWRGACGRPGYYLSLGELGRLWREGRPHEVFRWTRVPGPMAAAVLSLRRVGLEVIDAFRWRTDRGAEIVLTMHSPRFVEDALAASIQRALERALAAKVGLGNLPNGVEARAVVDVVRSFCASKARSAMDKGLARSFFCGSIWTKTRAREAGYAIDDVRCELCGDEDDTIYHRLYGCRSLLAVQARAVLPATAAGFANRAALDTLEARLLCTRGIAANPADLAPGPAEDMICRAHRRGETVDPFSLQLEGDLFWDGSCTRHPIKDLCRASWGVVSLDKEGKVFECLAGPVWSVFQQTPQAAEYVGYGATVQQ